MHRRVKKTRKGADVPLAEAQGWPKDEFRLLSSNWQFAYAWWGECPRQTKPWLFQSAAALTEAPLPGVTENRA
jgi:hypothetical protein